MARRPKPESGMRPGEVLVRRGGLAVPAPKAFADRLAPEHGLPCMDRLSEPSNRCADTEELVRALRESGHPEIDVWRTPEYARQHGDLWYLSSKHPDGSQVIALGHTPTDLADGKFLLLTELFGPPSFRMSIVPKSPRARLITGVQRFLNKVRGRRKK